MLDISRQKPRLKGFTESEGYPIPSVNRRIIQQLKIIFNRKLLSGVIFGQSREESGRARTSQDGGLTKMQTTDDE